MSEFDLKPEDLEIKNEVLRLWRCNQCATHQKIWGQARPERCANSSCDSTNFHELKEIAVVGATTGIHVELEYDNINTIDEAVAAEYEITEQNRDLDKLEKARR